MTRLQKIFEQIPEEEWKEDIDKEILREIRDFYCNHLERMIELHEKYKILETEEEYKAMKDLKTLMDDRTMEEVRYERSLWTIYNQFPQSW